MSWVWTPHDSYTMCDALAAMYRSGVVSLGRKTRHQRSRSRPVWIDPDWRPRSPAPVGSSYFRSITEEERCQRSPKTNSSNG